MIDEAEIMSYGDAVRILGRSPRRIQQLVQEGILVSGRFRGSVTAASVEAFRKRLETGEVRRGPRSKRSVFTVPEGLDGKTRREVGASLGVSRQRVDQLLNPLKSKARAQVQGALKSGKLVKPDQCSDCGEQKPLHGHHADYTKPLVVAWLCATCHGRAHSKPRQVVTKTVPEGMVSKRDAAQLIDRGVDRVRQLINQGVLVSDEMKRWVTLDSVKEYQMAITQGRVKRGPKKGAKNGSQKEKRKKAKR